MFMTPVFEEVVEESFESVAFSNGKKESKKKDRQRKFNI